MADHSSDETAFAATPEVSPLVGSLSATNLGLLSLAIALFLFVGPFHRVHLVPREADSNLVISYSRGKSKSRGSALLLVGPPDSGKTAILSNVSAPCVS
ncbi:hypothetical protein J3R82DRAFT_6012 [Butyriboletus roseoflavus]|nr:hypothetical protein J3R82DRAFT_6012 [Butyriboletus roseoflavus]